MYEICKGFIGIMEKKMETTIMGLYRVQGYIGVRDNGLMYLSTVNPKP